mmetsp:Transcript_29779/g.86349  ORF Transcript_29779/g.86349 Transcript_29779/m.86349 type:complete len:106 (+) Transcript_29779:243-560(+)
MTDCNESMPSLFLRLTRRARAIFLFLLSLSLSLSRTLLLCPRSQTRKMQTTSTRTHTHTCMGISKHIADREQQEPTDHAHQQGRPRHASRAIQAAAKPTEEGKTS